MFTLCNLWQWLRNDLTYLADVVDTVVEILQH